jgi:hypothetical protein
MRQHARAFNLAGFITKNEVLDAGILVSGAFPHLAVSTFGRFAWDVPMCGEFVP